MGFIILFTILFSLQVISGFQQTPPITGYAKYSAILDGSNHILTSSGLPNKIMGTFSFELMLYVNKASSGKFQPIIAHQSIPNQHDRNVDFVLQVTPAGYLNFFMGNGLQGSESNGGKGFSITSDAVISSQKWYHVAVSVTMSKLFTNYPLDVALFVDGIRVAKAARGGLSYDHWQSGSRQFTSSQIVIGKYDNQEPGVQYLIGQVDEIRFWNTYRQIPQIIEQKNLRLHGDEPGLVAYYRFDTYNGNDILDSASNDSVIQTQAITFGLSTFGLGTYIKLSAQDASSITEIYLPAFDVNGDVIHSEIVTLPTSTSGKFYAKDSFGSYQSIKQKPFKLNSPFIGFSFDSHFTDFVETITYTTWDSYGASPVSSFIKIYVITTPTCDGVPGHVIDNCGICGGNNKDCECSYGYFRNYKLGDIDQILTWSLSGTTHHLLIEAQQKLSETDQFLEYADYSKLDLGEFIPVLHNFPETITPWLNQVNQLKQFDAQY